MRRGGGSRRLGFSDKARGMIWLWIAAALVSAGLAALIVHRAARARGRRPAGENPALAVYRRQLAEIDDLADRGLLAEAERRGAGPRPAGACWPPPSAREAPLQAVRPDRDPGRRGRRAAAGAAA